MAGLKVKKRAKKARARSSLNLSYDVVCIGRPVQDTILTGEVFTPVCSHGACYEHIPLGAKLGLDDAVSSFGGNALNSAVTFARQKLSVGLLAQIGQDSVSRDLKELLVSESVDLNLLNQSEDTKIGLSTVISATTGERSILAYPGSAIQHQDLLRKLEEVETRWIYASSLNSIELLDGVIKFAQLNQIKVCLNPGGLELENIDEVRRLLTSVEVLVLNKQEATKFFGNLDSSSLARAGSEYARICIVTDGPNGAYAFDGEVDYSQPISDDVKVVDRTGAGDAFASGVIAGLAWGMDLKESLELGSSNSTSVVQQVGAQAGILKRR